jgi:YesN/AraC family two-component response regulator
MPAALRATPKKQVLIVDDDRAALEAMGAAVEKEFHVFAAPDIATATHALDRETIDLVILDAVLDQESGLDFLPRLRETSDVPVLLISGYGTKDMVITGLRARASDYLDKPFNATELLEKARELIAQGPRPSHVSERIRHFIEQHYMRDWTVESLAKALDLSVRTMRQVFRQRYQRSVMDFLEEVRITRARELLATTDLSIHAIAAEVGFHDPHYFGRVFRQRAGQRPRDFRAAQRYEPSSAPSSSP